MRITKSNALDKVSAPIEFETLQELAVFITKNDWSPFVYQTPHEDNDGTYKRNRKSFCGADIFALDIDDGLSLVGAIDIIKSLGLAAIVAPSRSHQKPKGELPACDRYRIIFVLAESIVTESQVKAMFFKLKETFPTADDACKDAARLFYASSSIAYIQEGSALQVPEIIRETNVNTMYHQINTQKYPLSKFIYDTILNGAKSGERNTALSRILHDAIQQQWDKESLLELLKTSTHEWLYDDVALNKIEERYRNFTPTHPPRVATPARASNKPDLIPLNKIKEVVSNWITNNEVAVNYDRSLHIDGSRYIIDDIVRKIIINLAELNMAVNEKIVEYTLQEFVEEHRHIHLEHVIADVAGFNLERGRAAIKAFLSVFSSTTTDLDVEVMRHMIWQIKRKLNGKRTKYEMMFVMTGGQNAGKSYALREILFKPLRDLANCSIGFEVLSDGRESRIFSDHYVAFFDEMSGAQKAEMEKVKHIITSNVIKQRRMGTTAHDSMPMNTTFFGASNNPLETLIRDQTGMRRFWEFKVEPVELTSKRWPAFDTIDVLDIWRSADDNDDTSPIEPHLSAIRINQELLRDKTIYEWLVESNVIAPTTNESEFSSAVALANTVSVVMGKPWSAKVLAKEWERAALPKVRAAGGTMYGVKIVDKDILQTLRTKYAMRLSDSDKEGYQF